MPSEISVPFRLGPNKVIAAETNPDVQIRQHVMSLVNTEPGERAVLGDYGVPLSDSVFEEGDEAVAGFIANDIKGSLAKYEPGVRLLDTKAVAGSVGDGLAQVDVRYMRADAATTPIAGTNRNVAVITASGRVSEVIRG